MKKYECEPCGYIYDPAVGDPDGGIAPGTAFEDIPDDWVLRLRDTVTGEESVVDCDGVFVSVGRQPATALAVPTFGSV